MTPSNSKKSPNSKGHKQIHPSPLHRLIRVLTVFSQIFCMAPLPKASAGRLNLLRGFYYLYGLLILAHIYILSWKQMTLTDTYILTINKIIYFGDIIVNNLVSTLAVCSTFYYAGLYREVPQKFLKILQALKRLQGVQRSTKWNSFLVLYKELCCYCCCITLVTLIFLAFNYFSLAAEYYIFFLQLGAYHLPNFLLNLKLGQYWFTLRFAYHIYKRLNEMLRERLKHFDLSGSTPTKNEPAIFVSLNSQPLYDGERSSRYTRAYLSPHSCEHSDAEFLEQIRRLHTQVDALMAELAEVYGSIVLLNYLGSILAVAINIFELYQGFYRPVLVLNRVLWQIQYMIRIFPVLNASNAVVEEKCRTTCVLNALYITSRKMQQALNRFLLQLLVRKPAESAGGVVNLDLMLVTGILSAIGQCVTFLVQIDLSKVHYKY